MNWISNSLIIAIVIVQISATFSTQSDNNPSKRFVVELNNQFIDTGLVIPEDDYCKYPRISCDNSGRIVRIELISEKLSALPTNIAIIKDTLKELSIVNAGLKGEIPSQIYELTKLTYLNLQENNFTGSLSKDIGKLSELWILDLNSSGISGLIPDTLYSLTKLKYLILGKNNFTGSLNADIGKLSELIELDINNSNLCGEVPDTLYSLVNLRLLNLAGNKFYGSLNGNISKLNKLYYLDLSGLNISGPIPDALYSLTELKDLNLMNNNINGSLSSKIGGLTNLVNLNLCFNELSGTIPNEIGNLINLETLQMRENQFEGSIPDLSRLKKLVDMNISSTKHNLNVKCDDKMLPPNISKEKCLVRPVNRLCQNVTRCEYSTEPITHELATDILVKSSAGSTFHKFVFKTIVLVVLYTAGLEMVLN